MLDVIFTFERHPTHVAAIMFTAILKMSCIIQTVTIHLKNVQQ